jgi:hypothetical protein
LEVNNHQLRFVINPLLKIFGSVDFREKSLKKPHLSSSEMGFHFPRTIRPPCELNPDDTWGRLRFQMDSIQIGEASQGGKGKVERAEGGGRKTWDFR